MDGRSFVAGRFRSTHAGQRLTHGEQTHGGSGADCNCRYGRRFPPARPTSTHLRTSSRMASTPRVPSPTAAGRCRRRIFAIPPADRTRRFIAAPVTSTIFSFDAAGLNLPPALLEDLDPLFQITLHAGRQAFADGQTDDLDRERVGVSLAAIALPTDGSSALTAAVWGRDFQKRLFNSAGFAAPSDQDANQPPNPLNSQVTAMPAGLLAAALRLGGGTLTLDAACASSLYAIKIACDELRSRRVDAMLAGGVSRPDCLFTQMGFSQLQALSPSGTCRTFDDARGRPDRRRRCRHRAS